MKNPINYVYLAKKFAGVECLMNDRSYDGLIWPPESVLDPSVKWRTKPPIGLFLAWQEEEDKEERADHEAKRQEAQKIEEAKNQANARAQAEARSLEERAAEAAEEAHAAALTLHRRAIELKSAIRARGDVIAAYKEITEAQDTINQEAQAYLEDTKHYLAWEPANVPPGIIINRRIAQDRINEGKEVYADWAALRSKEMPTREELAEAVKKGGEHLARMKKVCSDIRLKYPRPRKVLD